MSGWTEAQSIADLVLAGVGIAGVLIALQTLGQMRRQSEAMEGAANETAKAAKAAADSVGAVRDQTQAAHLNAIRELRAYLCVECSLVVFTDENHRPVPEVQVTLKNFGQTPAYNVRGWIHTWIASYPLTEELPLPEAGFPASNELLGPGAKRVWVNAVKTSPQIPPSDIGTPIDTLYVYGEVRYCDAFGTQHYTKYRLIFGGNANGRRIREGTAVQGLLQADASGNESD